MLSQNLEILYFLEISFAAVLFPLELSPSQAILSDKKLFKNVCDLLDEEDIEYRIGTAGGGNQARQPYLSKCDYKIAEELINANYIHDFGLYVGNHPELDKEEIVNLCEDKMVVFGGIMGYESFLNGAYGWVSVGSNIMPSEFAKIYKLTVVDKDIDAASKLYNYILPAIELVGQHRYTSATKAVLNLMGLEVGPPRPPRLEASGSDFEWVKEVVEKYNLKI